MTTQMCAPSCSEAIGCPCPEVDNPNWVPGDPVHQETSEDYERGTTAGSLGLCGPLDTPAACEPECCPEPTPAEANFQRAVEIAANALSKGNSLMVFDPKRTSPLNMQLAEKVLATQGESILMEAERITNGQREKDYGTALDNHERIARLWNGYIASSPKVGQLNLFDQEEMENLLSPEDIACMMILLKVARHQVSGTRDSQVDIAGYANVLSKIDTQRQARVAKIAGDIA